MKVITVTGMLLDATAVTFLDALPTPDRVNSSGHPLVNASPGQASQG